MAGQPFAGSLQGGAFLTGERHVLELIATGAPFGEALDALCRVIDEQSHLMSSVFLLDHEAEHLVLAAGPNLPEVWRQAARVVPVTAAGACGLAVSRRNQVVVEDISVDPTYEPFREQARAAGLRAVWSTPFYSKDRRALGTFAVYSPNPGHPGPLDLRLVDLATRLASIAVERHQTEAGLRESEIRFSRAFYASPASMSISRFSDGRFQYVNDAFVRMFGWSRAEALGQTAVGLGMYAAPEARSRLMAPLREGKRSDVEIRARTKSGAPIDLVLSMECVELLGEESTLGIAIDITDRKRAEEALERSERLLRLVLDTLPVGVAVVNTAGDVILANPASQRIWGTLVPAGQERYAASKGWWHDTGERLAPGDWASVRAVANGETTVNEVIDIEAFDGARKVIQNSAGPIRDADGRVTGAVIVNEDISGRKTAERERNDAFNQMRTLTVRLMRAQDDERRRIAQMLHETTAQDLAALKMHLARLGRTAEGLSGVDRAALTESIDLADRSISGIRTLSYLLYPPFLDEAGLSSALRWYAAGFAERSGIKVDLDLPSNFGRLPRDVETTLFRVVQEALLNIHNHADSPTAVIRLRVHGQRLTVEIEDRGHGMPPELIAELPAGRGALGVGIAGMRERLEQLGGSLEIESSDRGTTVRAEIPFPPDAL